MALYPYRRNLRRLFDYKRECDRCGSTRWLRSELSVEAQTRLLVCPPCLDMPDESREKGAFRIRDIVEIID